jgi:hypothetical protein
MRLPPLGALPVRRAMLARVECDYCRTPMFPSRSDRRFCDSTCRARWHARERRRAQAAEWLEQMTDLLVQPGARAFAEVVRIERERART